MNTQCYARSRQEALHNYSKIRGTLAYYHNLKQDTIAMLRQFKDCGLFVTIGDSIVNDEGLLWWLIQHHGLGICLFTL